MSITHNWKINSVIRYLDVGGTVYRVLFDIESVDSDNPAFLRITTTGSVELDVSDVSPDNFTPFEDLTEEQVLEWVKQRIIKYDIIDTDPVENKYEYEIHHERHLKNLKETITYTPDRPYSVVGYLTTPEPEPEVIEEDVETDSPEDMAAIAAEMGLETIPEEWT